MAKAVLSISTKPALKRRVINRIFWIASLASLVMVIAPTIWVIGGVVSRALHHWRWSVLTTTGPAGLASDLIGTLALTFGVALCAGFVGVLSGIFLSEYGDNRGARFLRGASEILAGIPSIVLGYVGYIALVIAFHRGFSLGAGLTVLSIMVIPYIAKTTEVALRQVPTAYREGAEALGMPATHAMRRIALRAALGGIVTGMILALAIAVGETAPLLYTAGHSDTLPGGLTQPVGYLTYAVVAGFNQPSTSAQQLAFDAAFMLVVVVLSLMVVARVIVAYSQRHSERGS